jgi:hypothetical protein
MACTLRAILIHIGLMTTLIHCNDDSMPPRMTSDSIFVSVRTTAAFHDRPSRLAGILDTWFPLLATKQAFVFSDAADTKTFRKGKLHIIVNAGPILFNHFKKRALNGMWHELR